jgi:putative ABC transport system permease protein
MTATTSTGEPPTVTTPPVGRSSVPPGGRSTAGLEPSRLRGGDVFRVGSLGLRTRKLRTALSALGVMIGIAALVGVLGLSESSRAQLLTQLDSLGTNLLVVQAANGVGQTGTATIPVDAPKKVEHIGPVASMSYTAPVAGNVYKNEYVNKGETNGLAIVATSNNLVDTLRGAVAQGRMLDDATAAYPNVVLGSVTAQRLGITSTAGSPRVYLNDQYFTVVGILDQLPLAADLDRSALIGQAAAQRFMAWDGTPSSIYVRTVDNQLDAVRSVLPGTVNPENPDRVQVTRPTDALAAKAAAETAFTALFLGLGAVALLVGGIGIANVMVIAVIERRNEIGLRRALGATQAHIRRQFLTEALLLALLGGIGGDIIGAIVTAIYATSQGWTVVLPASAAVLGLGAAIVIGAVAGLYPAMRAARLAPTEALRAT